MIAAKSMNFQQTWASTTNDRARMILVAVIILLQFPALLLHKIHVRAFQKTLQKNLRV